MKQKPGGIPKGKHEEIKKGAEKLIESKTATRGKKGRGRKK